jgi:hypothetical protein
MGTNPLARVARQIWPQSCLNAMGAGEWRNGRGDPPPAPRARAKRARAAGENVERVLIELERPPDRRTRTTAAAPGGLELGTRAQRESP